MIQDPLRLDDFLPYRLSFTSNLVSDSIARAYSALFGLKIPEWRVLAVVAEHDGISQQEIGGRTRMDKVIVSRAAIALTDRGLLARKPNADDKRSHLLVLSAQGHALYGEVAPKARELERSIFDPFDADELETFVAVLRRIDRIVLDGSRDGRADSPNALAD